MLAPLDPTSLAVFPSRPVPLGQPVPAHAAGARRARVRRPVRVMGGIVSPIAGDVPGEDYKFVPATLNGERSGRPGVQARLALHDPEADAPRHSTLACHHIRLGAKAEASRSSSRPLSTSASGETLSARLARCSSAATSTRLAAPLAWTRRKPRGLGGGAGVSVEPCHAGRGGGIDHLRGTPATTLPRHRNRSAYGNGDFLADARSPGLVRIPLAGNAAWQRSERRNHHFDWTLA